MKKERASIGSSSIPDDALIALDQLRSLTRSDTTSGIRGDVINVTLRDIERVVPEMRGKKFYGLEFLGWFPSYEDGSQMSVEDMAVWYHAPDLRAAFVHAQVNTKEAYDLLPELPEAQRQPSLPVIFGFHGWLIEEIQTVASDEQEVLDRTEKWHRDNDLDVELHEFLGWTWDQHVNYVANNVLPYAE